MDRDTTRIKEAQQTDGSDTVMNAGGQMEGRGDKRDKTQLVNEPDFCVYVSICQL